MKNKLLFLVFLASMGFGGTNLNIHFDMNKLLWGWGYSHLNYYNCNNTYQNRMTLEQMYYNSHHNQKSNKQIMRDIEKLYELYQKGVITEEEYENAKDMLLDELN